MCICRQKEKEGHIHLQNVISQYYGSGGLHPEVQVKADHIWGIRIKKNDR